MRIAAFHRKTEVNYLKKGRTYALEAVKRLHEKLLSIFYLVVVMYSPDKTFHQGPLYLRLTF